MSQPAPSLIVTCEHATNRIPADLRDCFKNAEDALASHRGWDPGAAELARLIADRLKSPLFIGTASRLVVELNRSIGHPRLWSEFTRDLPSAAKERVLDRLYRPYRTQVQESIAHKIAHERIVLHLSVHSFTPVFEGETRSAEIGLLYDPRRGGEKRFCDSWRDRLRTAAPAFRIRRNYPYLGKADGFVTHLRRRFKPSDYLGIELEMNQALVHGERRDWKNTMDHVTTSLASVLAA